MPDITPQVKLEEALRDSPIMEMMIADGFLPRSSLYYSFVKFRGEGVRASYLSEHLDVGDMYMPDLPRHVVEHLQRQNDSDAHSRFVEHYLYSDNKGRTICLFDYTTEVMNEPNYFHFHCSDARLRRKYLSEVRKIQYRVKNANEWKAAKYERYIATTEGAFEHAADELYNVWQEVQKLIPYEYSRLSESTGGRSKEYIGYDGGACKLVRFKYDMYSESIKLNFFAEDPELHASIEQAIEPAKKAITYYEQSKLADKLAGKNNKK